MLYYRIEVWHDGTQNLPPERVEFNVAVDPADYECHIGEWLSIEYLRVFSRVWLNASVHCNCLNIN
jgi:hypothetical protein